MLLNGTFTDNWPMHARRWRLTVKESIVGTPYLLQIEESRSDAVQTVPPDSTGTSALFVRELDRWRVDYPVGATSESDPNRKNTRTSFSSATDSSGDPEVIIDWGDEAISGDERTTKTAWCANLTSWILDKPAWRRLYAGAVEPNNLPPGVVETALTGWGWDGGALFGCPTSHGLQTWLRRYATISPATDVNVYDTYDAYGNRVSHQDENGNTTSSTDEPTYHTLLTTTSYPPVAAGTRREERTSYEGGKFGLLKSVTSPKLDGETGFGVTSSDYDYDVFGRPEYVWAADAPTPNTTANYSEHYTYADPQNSPGLGFPFLVSAWQRVTLGTSGFAGTTAP